MMEADPQFPEILYVLENLRASSRLDVFGASAIDDPAALAEIYAERSGFQWCFYVDDVPAALVGAYPSHKGVWNLYGFGTEDYEKCLGAVTRHAIRFMLPAMQNSGAHRCQCICPAESTDTHKWLRLIGATEETRLSKFGKSQEDYMIFAWVKE